MRSQSLSTIPVIDLSNEGLKPGTNTWMSTCQDIRLAMEEFGCFEGIYSKVSVELHNQVFGTTEELFDLPTEIKMKNTSTKPYFDYFGQYSFLPLYESLGIDNPTTLESTQSFTNLMWSFGNDRFCNGIIEIPQELGDDKSPLKYKPFDHFEFLHFNQSQAAKKTPCSIKDYCGN
ncbi:hypothetical protein LWI28_008597 [Acer negundo]|uniref:Non-haem dioxygenase N-terminal domain-containing protein n=1 Tax=Acer negundo TaxID=4023 RepID=A0AAD5ICX8_ACENE|nr:hypothetical protein LWI28_008597 [Acer negundo]